jgi:hypothetical protein
MVVVAAVVGLMLRIVVVGRGSFSFALGIVVW